MSATWAGKKDDTILGYQGDVAIQIKRVWMVVENEHMRGWETVDLFFVA